MKTVLCFGDSNTWGWNPETTTQSTPGRFPADKRWTGILKAELGNGYTIIEEGLNARTTVHDDPINEHRNGRNYLIPCLDSHFPLDFVVIMLGSNDLKFRFSTTASDIVYGIESLANIVRNQTQSANMQNYLPEVLVLSPPPIGKLLPEDELCWQGTSDKCRQVAKLLKVSAVKYQYHLFDTHTIMTSDELDVDGIHMPENCHKKLGQAIAKTIISLSDKVSDMQGIRA